MKTTRKAVFALFTLLVAVMFVSMTTQFLDAPMPKAK